jgi:glycerol-3-phosphate dehydrogenase
MNYKYDIFIIGGGINGAGIARDAAGRGLRVCLADKGEIGGATSSWSTKLIHGGLRYLENYEFKFVGESLKEREIIHRIAPNITKPIPFIIPHSKKLRPSWLIKIGLFLYDNLGGKSVIPKSKSVNLSKEFPNLLKKEFIKGFQYYDLQVDDKKLTQLNAQDAKKNQALILENTKVIKVERFYDHWKIYLEGDKIITSKILVNASGPWINEVVKDILKLSSKKSIRLVKGSHIIINKLYEQKVAFTLQNEDKRIIFVIPYKGDFSLIGTTEVEVDSPENPKIDEKEIQYLIKSVNNYFIKQIHHKDVIDTYSGIRPLIEDYKEASKVTRDYIFDLNIEDQLSPLLNIYGGKLTTYRKLSDKVFEELEEFLPSETGKPWTHKKTLIEDAF